MSLVKTFVPDPYDSGEDISDKDGDELQALSGSDSESDAPSPTPSVANMMDALEMELNLDFESEDLPLQFDG